MDGHRAPYSDEEERAVGRRAATAGEGAQEAAKATRAVRSARGRAVGEGGRANGKR